MDEKPAFDPTQPFELGAGAKPAFDPSKPFEPAGSSKPLTWGETASDVGKSAGIGLAKGAIGLAGLPGDIGELGAQGIDWATKKVGDIIGTTLNRPGGEGAERKSLIPLPGSSDIQKGIEGYTGEFYHPKSAMGRYAETAGEFLPAIVGGPESLAARAATRVAAPALVGQSAAELAHGTAAEPYAKAAGALTGALGAAGVSSAVRSAMAPETNVAADLSRALHRDGDTPQAIVQRLAEERRIRPDATLADVGGENVRGIVERIAQTPGAGRTIVQPALTQRQQAQMARLSGDLTALTGTRRSAFEAVQDTMTTRARSAAPLYEDAYSAGDRAVWSPELERLSASPTVRAAMQGAVRIWGDNVIADGFGAMNPGAMVGRGGQLEFIGGKVPAFPNLQFWDYTKRLLDDRVAQALRAGQNQKARTLTGLTRTLRNELDQAVPEYRAARDAWAGPSQYLDGIEQGRNILSHSVSAEEMAANFAQLTAAQQEAFRIGAVSAIRGKMGNDASSLGNMTKYLRSPEMREKIATIMPTPEAAESWRRRLEYEIKSSELTGRALGNSATARRLAEKEDAQNLVGELIGHSLKHAIAPKALFLRAVMALPQRVRDTLRSRSDAILGDVLTNPQNAAQLAPHMLGAVAHGQRRPPLLAAPTAVYSDPALQRAHGGRVEPNNIHHEPSEAQKAAGNYAKDHVRVQGLDVTIENAKGKARSGVDKSGKPWSVKMPAHYGYIKGTVGNDKDHVDCYLGPHLKSPHVFIVDQLDAESGKFDEHKCFIGFASKKSVVTTYHKAFSDGRSSERLGHISEMSVDEFKHWLSHGDTKTPAREEALLLERLAHKEKT